MKEVFTQNKNAKVEPKVIPTDAAELYDKATAKMDKEYLATGSRTGKRRLMQAYQADLRYIERKCISTQDYELRKEIRGMLMGNFRV